MSGNFHLLMGTLGFVTGSGGGSFARAWSYETIPEPNEDSLVYYVSNDGDDENDGQTEATAFATPWHAVQQMRDGFPDYVLLACGGSWDADADLDNLMDIQGGESEEAPSVFGSYVPTIGPNIGSTTRPVLLSANVRVRIGVKEHIRIFGLKFDVTAPQHYVTGQAAISLESTGYNDILIQDCYITNYGVGIGGSAFGGPIGTGYGYDVRVIGNVVYRQWTPFDGDFAQGMIFGYTDGLTLVGNVIDHNGWNVDIREQSQFRQGAYLTSGSRNIHANWNLVFNNSSVGIQMRPGGEMIGNVFALNSYGMNASNNFEVTVQKNLFLGCRTQNELGTNSMNDLSFAQVVEERARSTDAFAESSGGDIELNGVVFNVLAGQHVIGGNGKAVASDGLYAESIDASPVRVMFTYGDLIDQSDRNVGLRAIPMDDSEVFSLYLRRSVNTGAAAEEYRCDLERDGSDHDHVTLYKVTAGVDAELDTVDLGLEAWEWGVDVLAFGMYESVMRASRDDWDGTLILDATDASYYAGFFGYILGAAGVRVKTIVFDLVANPQPVDISDNVSSGIGGDQTPQLAWSIGGVVSELSFHDNVVRDFGTALLFADSMTADLPSTFNDNIIDSDATTETYMFYTGFAVPSEFTFDGNSWWLDAKEAPHNSGYIWNTNEFSRTNASATWIGWSGETNGVYGPKPTWTDKTRGLARYASEVLGLAETEEALMEKAREMSWAVPGSGVSELHLNNWVRAGNNKAAVTP